MIIKEILSNYYKHTKEELSFLLDSKLNIKVDQLLNFLVIENKIGRPLLDEEKFKLKMINNSVLMNDYYGNSEGLGGGEEEEE